MHQTSSRTQPRSLPMAELLVLCGIASPLIYIATDLSAAASYPGYSVTDQAVSELFAIGAPTSFAVVALFSLSSVLLLGFAAGLARLTPIHRTDRLTSLMFAASALVSLVLWNFFPMHMRGAERTFTDTMHLILATNPFVIGTLILVACAYRNWFRWVSIGVLVLIIGLASFGFHYVSAIDAGEATPGMGLSERAGQYLYATWQVALAFLVLGRARPRAIASPT